VLEFGRGRKIDWKFRVEGDDGVLTELSQADLPSAVLVEVERRSMKLEAGERRNKV